MCRSAAVRWLGLRVQIPSGVHGCLSCKCCVLGSLRRSNSLYRVVCLCVISELRQGSGLGSSRTVAHRKGEKMASTSVPIRWFNWTSRAVSLQWPHTFKDTNLLKWNFQFFQWLSIKLSGALNSGPTGLWLMLWPLCDCGIVCNYRKTRITREHVADSSDWK